MATKTCMQEVTDRRTGYTVRRRRPHRVSEFPDVETKEFYCTECNAVVDPPDLHYCYDCGSPVNGRHSHDTAKREAFLKEKRAWEAVHGESRRRWCGY